LPPMLDSPGAQAIAPLLSASTVFSCIRYEFFDGSGWLALAAIVLQSAFALFYRRRVRQVMAAVEQPGKDLEILSLVLARLEREQFDSSRLHQLLAELATGKN